MLIITVDSVPAVVVGSVLVLLRLVWPVCRVFPST